MRAPPPDRPPAPPASLARRLGWMALLWLGSVAALGLVALLLRALMAAAGMQR
jgi:hypothetical protein